MEKAEVHDDVAVDATPPGSAERKGSPAAAALRRRRVFRKRLQGVPYRRIAEQEGVSAQQCLEDYRRFLDEMEPMERLDERRRNAELRIERRMRLLEWRLAVLLRSQKVDEVKVAMYHRELDRAEQSLMDLQGTRRPAQLEVIPPPATGITDESSLDLGGMTIELLRAYALGEALPAEAKPAIEVRALPAAGGNGNGNGSNGNGGHP